MRDGDWVICGFYDRRAKGTGRWVPDHLRFIRDTPLARFALFNLVSDSRQENDLSEKEPERFRKMRDQLRARHSAMQRAALGWKNHLPVLPSLAP